MIDLRDYDVDQVGTQTTERWAAAKQALDKTPPMDYFPLQIRLNVAEGTITYLQQADKGWEKIVKRIWRDLGTVRQSRARLVGAIRELHRELEIALTLATNMRESKEHESNLLAAMQGERDAAILEIDSKIETINELREERDNYLRALAQVDNLNPNIPFVDKIIRKVLGEEPA